MAGRHGQLLRGLDAAHSALFQGRFGRMFRNLPPAQFGQTPQENSTNLTNLAAMMRGEDEPKDGPDAEESGIPSLFTYFGQFVDHDITFDPMSVLMKQNDPDALIDFRTPSFDLDNVYGRGPDDQPYMYQADGKHFLLGTQLVAGSAWDLPRNGATPPRALIGDPRNDENTIVSQLQGLFLRFHNRMADEHGDLPFRDLQQLVRFHYQYIVLNDFLPRIVSAPVLHELKSGSHFSRSKLQFFHWRHDPFLPVEFSVAAYRLGHSMVRPGYRLNDADASLLPIFPTADIHDGLTGFRAVPAERVIDWGRFIDVDVRPYGTQLDDGETGTPPQQAENKRRLQLAYRIDTSVVGPLTNLPVPVLAPGDAIVSLPARNLIRGWSLGLPSGQAVARAMGLTPLTDDQIEIGKAVQGETRHKIVEAGAVFADNCPLWIYILAEAMHNMHDVPIPVSGPARSIGTPQLGAVGGRIVAEVFLGLMFGDGRSLLSLDPRWHPKTGPVFGLKEFVRYALGQGPGL